MTSDLLMTQFSYTHYALKKNTEDLTHTDSLRRPQPGGNTLNWVVGHILAARNGLLEVLGEEPVWSQEQRDLYKRGGTGDSADADPISLDQMKQDLDATQEAIAKGLERFDPERLSDPAPHSPVNNPNETYQSLLAGLAFHEAYHAGQTGMLRRVLGKAGAIQ